MNMSPYTLIVKQTLTGRYYVKVTTGQDVIYATRGNHRSSESAITEAQDYLLQFSNPSKRASEYALPCGHVQGAAWNKFLKSYACAACGEPFSLEDL
jgi:hypothetical protein